MSGAHFDPDSKAVDEYPLWVFHPHEDLRVRWDMFMTIIMLYLVITIPLKICFESDLPENHPWSIFELIVDACFMLDIFFNFSTGFIDGTVFVTCRRQIAKNYLQSWFGLDLITSIPFELVVDGVKGSAHNVATLSKILKVFRVIRLLKLLRMLRLLRLISQWEKSSGFGTVVSRLMKLVFVVFVSAHISACGFVGVEHYYRTNDHSWENFRGYNQNSWFVRYAATSPTWQKSPYEQYLRAVYWAFTTLTTIGYGDITPLLPMEIAYAIAIEFIGSTLFGYIIGNVASVITHTDDTVMMIQEKISAVKYFLDYRDIPRELRQRIQRHYEYAWKRAQVYKEAEILAELPHSIRMDCALHIHREIIERVPFLSSLEFDILPSLVVFLKPVLASVGDIVLTEGLLGTEMFFILNGKLCIETSVMNQYKSRATGKKTSSIVIQRLTNGQAFAEYAIIMDQARHPATVRSEAYCDMFVLTRPDFLLFGNDCPVAFAHLLKECRERYLDLTAEIMQKQRTHMYKMMAVAKIAGLRRRSNTNEKQSAELDSFDLEEPFRPGAIVDFGMRLEYQRHRKAAKRIALGKSYQEQKCASYFSSWSLQVTKFLQKMKPFQKLVQDDLEPMPFSVKASKYEVEQFMPEEKEEVLGADISGKENFEKKEKNGKRQIAKQRNSVEELHLGLAFWIVVRILLWRARAKQRVAFRNIKAVEKRHHDKFNLGDRMARDREPSSRALAVSTREHMLYSVQELGTEHCQQSPTSTYDLYGSKDREKSMPGRLSQANPANTEEKQEINFKLGQMTPSQNSNSGWIWQISQSRTISDSLEQPRSKSRPHIFFTDTLAVPRRGSDAESLSDDMEVATKDDLKQLEHVVKERCQEIKALLQKGIHHQKKLAAAENMPDFF